MNGASFARGCLAGNEMLPLTNEMLPLTEGSL
jgi:hypothetical protein